MKNNPPENLSSPKEDVMLSIILVNYNGGDFIQKCLDSIEENLSEIRSETIVIDNHSTDGSAQIIQRRYPHIRLFRNSKNLGFAKANNQGIKASKGQFVLLINPDTYVCPNSLKTLLAEMKANSDIGAVGPALIDRKNGYQISFGKKVGFFSEAAKKLFLNRFFRWRLQKKPKRKDVQWLSAACLMTRKDVLERVGMFDENFFLYFEDIDLCMRIRKKGWRLAYLPDVKVFHTGGASTKSQKLSSRFEYRKSQLYFYWKHSSLFSYFLLKAYLCIHFVFILFLGFFKKNSSFKKRARFFRLLGRRQ